MEGRAVHKQLYNPEGQKYRAWLTPDDKNLTENGNKKIRHYHENYGYDTEKVIAGKGIKELEDPKAGEELMYSLKKVTPSKLRLLVPTAIKSILLRLTRSLKRLTYTIIS
ncbi:hypothetical protein HK413_05150 [Mucilaginibacter sp. S1162]|uniref:Uncharacterized protein n=1 Tax=Mucilaginibacter humi TaxID=2732510 RepID=A0ABX1W0D8_9SPHI|nr:hypothetical protein [Mucilaginibacter humi]NNU33684.1 hypothetical protein [Mucilaginibacter humi]